MGDEAAWNVLYAKYANYIVGDVGKKMVWNVLYAIYANYISHNVG